MRVLSFFVALSVMIPGAAPAKAIFVPHQGEPVLVHGSGGKSVRSHGITVWIDGMPASKFQVLGTIQDERTDKYFDGSATKSSKVAHLVRMHGGDAVLVRQTNLKDIGVEKGGVGGVFNTPSFSDQHDVIVHSVTTRLVVIKSRL